MRLTQRIFTGRILLAAVAVCALSARAGTSGDQTSLKIQRPTVLIDGKRGACHPRLVKFLQDSGYEVMSSSVHITPAVLENVAVIVMEVKMATAPYAEKETRAIEAFFKGGGSILISGQGWAFVHYGRGSEDEYPVNMLSGITGIYVTTKYGGSPEKLVDHPVMKGVKKVSYGHGVASVLRLNPPAKALAFDASGNAIMAAAEAKGKIVHIGHEWGYSPRFFQNTDIGMFLRNVMQWLAPVSQPTVEQIKSQLAERGEVAWLKKEPGSDHVLWGSLDKTLIRVNVLTGGVEEFPKIMGDRAEVTSIAFAGGIVWVGTRKGLVAYHPKRLYWSRYTADADGDIYAEIVRLEVMGKPERLVVRVKTADGEKSFTYDVAKKIWAKK
ncbi:hypothetical protein ACFL01_04680 [Planctomycetota bacterium]